MTNRTARDRSLRLLMRNLGLLLMGLSIFFLTRDVAQTGMALWFFVGSAVLGTVLFASSWLPSRRPALQAELAPQPVTDQE